MLSELTLSDLGVIGQARLEFDPGLTVITGETGAGKTMLLTAIGLLRGDKADLSLIRRDARRALVEAVVRLPAGHPTLTQASEAGALMDDDELIAGRSIAESRSRAILGGVSVPAGVLARLVGPLVTVHGQGDQMRLRAPSQQREVLDAYAGGEHAALMEEYRAAWAQAEDVRARLERLRTDGAAATREAEMLKQSLAELERVGAQAGEDTQLDERIERLAHAEDLRLAASGAHTALAGEEDPMAPPGATALAEAARRALDGAASRDSVLGELAGRIREAEYQLSDAADEVATYLEQLDADPGTLETLHARRAELRALMRKYGPSLDEVIEWERAAALRLDDLDAGEERVAEVSAALAEAEGRVAGLASQVHAGRLAAAGRLSQAVDKELAGLAMAGAHLEVEVREVPPGPHGADHVEFGLAVHPSAPARPLGRSASGGELSRVMLAVEVALAAAQAGTDATLVFDEVDAGIGGRAAIEVGRRLARVAAHSQVVVVTHLAQVAAFADRHIVVERRSAVGESGGGLVETQVRQADGPERQRELARMLAGQEDSASAQAHAAELLAMAQSAGGSDQS
ncbi:MAG: DNA repair protein RecN [Bifidobacteriaceae bacterium]|jgi:DNA repair protein RecN (Recombination protein N)|nr:DNA repair protein RecN [Bifidobacteriaceae bacterium]